ncbi:cystathionine gamma-synthase [Blochmannia endosymbiont of Colobopsis nipponica]|uniref:cystathionine gamma-synthase n=1 Tax=Blochmannia endosymbiont of Colobopsis nipponica TaxID=2681987 RepID=UPI00178301A2|nr:cystathionine gamma-synthase [Blochmannia endosymbiont of Colobopsis nipponica]QOI10876.1 cystathionine gamma-synthase [Blochmannia endosymbiont of Colobopsis nipponica]
MAFRQATIAVRSGLNNDEQYGCVVSPITLSTTYNFYDLNIPRLYDYSRRRNPTRDVVQKTLADLECGVGAIITSSGMSAIHLLCTVFLTPGDLVIAPHDCYGGSYRLLSSLSERKFCRVQFVNQTDKNALTTALSAHPKLIFIETPSNPLLRVADILDICSIAHEAKSICVVDNTIMSPVLQQPLLLGADLVVHSCTKYLNGHSDVVAGAIVAKDVDLVEKILWWGNTLGVTGGAFDSYQLLRGIRTLFPRINQQQSNAQSILTFLQNKKNNLQIRNIFYPGLTTNLGYSIACKQQKGFGAMLSFELNGDKVMLRQFLSSLKLFTLAESFGGVESLISHPATMTHACISEEARNYAGISDMLLRLSVGIEDSEDLIDDLDRAFREINY